MTYDIAEIRRRLADPASTCTALGLSRGAKLQPRGVLVRCPAHADRNPSCSVRVGDRGTIGVRCHSCGFTGDVITLIATVYGIDTKGAIAKAAELAGIGPAAGPSVLPARALPPEPIEKPPTLDAETFDALVSSMSWIGRLDDGPLAGPVTRYIESRGLLGPAFADGWFALPFNAQISIDVFGEDVVKLAGLLGRSPQWSHTANRLCIPWRRPDGVVTTLQRRRIDADDERRYVFPAGRSPGWPYGVDRMRADVPIAFVEGAIDVLALRTLVMLGEVADAVVLGLPGTSWRPEWANLCRDREVFLALDDDKPGDNAAIDIARSIGRPVTRMRPVGANDWAGVLATKTGRAA